MREGFRIYDVDRHVHEPLDLWASYLAPRYRDHAPYLAYQDRGEPLSRRMSAEGPDGLVPLPPDLFVDGEPVLNVSRGAKRAIAGAAVDRGPDLARGETAAGHLDGMDQQGIDAALILPSYAGYLVAMEHRTPGLAAGFADAYNRWLGDLVAADPTRLHGAALIARYEPERMVEQARFARDRGWPAVVVRPNPIGGRVLGDPAEAAFWDFCAENGLAVAVHEAAHARCASAGADRFSSRFSLHACSHPMEQMMAFLALAETGTFERLADLRVGFLEAGAGWMVNWLWRLDEIEYAHLAGEVGATIKRKPSEYFRRQCAIGFEPGEPLLDETIGWLGIDKLMFGSDFPHIDHGGDIVAEALALPIDTRRKAGFLWDNAASFLRMD